MSSVLLQLNIHISLKVLNYGENENNNRDTRDSNSKFKICNQNTEPSANISLIYKKKNSLILFI